MLQLNLVLRVHLTLREHLKNNECHALKYRKTHQSVTIEHEELNTLDDSDYID